MYRESFKTFLKILAVCVAFVIFTDCILEKGDGVTDTVTHGKNTDSLYINEIVANDENGGNDWIELYLAGSKSINLSEYRLRDDNESHSKAQLPSVKLKPGGFFVIEALGLAPNKDRDYLPFKLGRSDGVILYKGGLIVDEYTWTRKKTDNGAGYGHLPDGIGELTRLTPTPGKSNIKYESTPVKVDTVTINWGGESKDLFSDSVISNYQLDFYVNDWESKLYENFLEGEVYMPAKLTYGKIVIDSIGVRYKGNWPFTGYSLTPKKSFKFYFSKFINQTFFGLTRLNLNNGIGDPTFMREKIGYHIAGAGGKLPVPRNSYVTITIGNELIGLYLQVEQIDKNFLERYFTQGNGNLYKSRSRGGSLEYVDSNKSSYKEFYTLKTNEAQDDWSGFIDMLDKLNNSPADSFFNEVSDKINLEWAMRHLAFNMVTSNFDSYTGSGRNYYLYDDPASKLFHLIHWDLNECFGIYTNNWNVVAVDILFPENLNKRPLMKNILHNDSLKQVYLSYIDELITGPASTDSIRKMTGQLSSLLNNYVKSDSNKIYTYDNFLTNIENEITVSIEGLNIYIPGLIDFSTKRNSELKIQLDNY